MPVSPCKTTYEFDEFIRSQGLDYIGEFPVIDESVKKNARIARAKERLEVAKHDNIPRLIEFWAKQIKAEQNR